MCHDPRIYPSVGDTITRGHRYRAVMGVSGDLVLFRRGHERAFNGACVSLKKWRKWAQKADVAPAPAPAPFSYSRPSYPKSFVDGSV